MNMNTSVYDHIVSMLAQANVTYRAVEHEETRTSEQSARARGEDLRVGGKALLVKTENAFYLAVLSADRQLDSRALQRCLSSRKLRFATPQELAELTSLQPGAVPPFGRPILPFELVVDRSVLRSERIAFNAGSLRRSLIMTTTDYLRLCGGTLADFSKG